MRQEHRDGAEEKMREVLERPLTLSAETQERIQAAYRKVKEECEVSVTDRQRETQIIEDKRNMKRQKGKERLYKGRSVRRMALVAMAAVMIMASGLVAAAAMGYFTKSVREENGKTVYEFTVNYDLQPVDVQINLKYLPEGMKEQEIGKYWTEENWGHGITVQSLSTVQIDEVKNNMVFSYVENIERTTILGMEAHIITFQDEEKYDRGKTIFLFNPEQGYVIQIYGDTIVPLQEVRKVAENLEITVTENPNLTYSTPEDVAAKDAAEEAYQKEMEEIFAKGVKEEKVTALGDELDCVNSGCRVKIEDVKLLNSLYDVPGYTDAGVYEMERLTPWLEADGTQKPYLRTHYDEEGNMLGEDTISCKFMAVKVTMNQYGEPSSNGTAMDAKLERMSKSADGTYHWMKDFYEAVPSENYTLQMDHMAFYFDKPENLEGNKRAHSFFWRNLKQGETLTYTLVFAVDEDILADENTELLLEFDATGNEYGNPMYCKLK